MMMPIVSMNKMAMNESIAVTCCYREVATPTAVYWEVMNGGWIGSGFVNKTGWYDGLEALVSGKVWERFDWDIEPGTGWGLRASLAVDKPEYGDYFDGNNKTGWHVAGVGVASRSATDPWYLGKKCTHTDAACNYRYDVNEYETNQHFESKSKHRDITAWAAPHNAQQYNS